MVDERIVDAPHDALGADFDDRPVGFLDAVVDLLGPAPDTSATAADAAATDAGAGRDSDPSPSNLVVPEPHENDAEPLELTKAQVCSTMQWNPFQTKRKRIWNKKRTQSYR